MTLWRCAATDSTQGRNGVWDLGASFVQKQLGHAAHHDPERLALFLRVSFGPCLAAFELMMREFEVADTLAQCPLPRLKITIRCATAQVSTAVLLQALTVARSCPTDQVPFQANVRLVEWEPELGARRRCESLDVI